jgi:hypothetical protein
MSMNWEEVKVAVVAAKWNSFVTDEMVDGALASLHSKRPAGGEYPHTEMSGFIRASAGIQICDRPPWSRRSGCDRGRHSGRHAALRLCV